MSTVVTTDLASPAVHALIDRLGNTRDLNKGVADGIADLARRHITLQAPKRHKTATRLGARPTGTYEDTARRITRDHDQYAAWIEVPRFIFRRAFETFTIRPGGGKKWLTIPMAAVSYGRRVAEMKSRGWRIFRPGKAKVLLGQRGESKKPVLLYALAASVVAKQDRTLLPSDEAFVDAARSAAAQYAMNLIPGQTNPTA